MEQRGSSEGFANSESQVHVCSQHFNFRILDFNKAFHQISNLITQDFCSISTRRSQSKLTLVTFRISAFFIARFMSLDFKVFYNCTSSYTPESRGLCIRWVKEFEK